MCCLAIASDLEEHLCWIKKEVFDNQSKEHPFSSNQALAQQNVSKVYEGQSHPQLCYRIQREHIVKAFGNNAIFIGFSIKSSQNQRKLLLNCNGNVDWGSSCDVITRNSKWPIFGDFVGYSCKFLSFEIRTAIFNITTGVYLLNKVI